MSRRTTTVCRKPGGPETCRLHNPRLRENPLGLGSAPARIMLDTSLRERRASTDVDTYTEYTSHVLHYTTIFNATNDGIDILVDEAYMSPDNRSNTQLEGQQILREAIRTRREAYENDPIFVKSENRFKKIVAEESTASLYAHMGNNAEFYRALSNIPVGTPVVVRTNKGDTLYDTVGWKPETNLISRVFNGHKNFTIPKKNQQVRAGSFFLQNSEEGVPLLDIAEVHVLKGTTPPVDKARPLGHVSNHKSTNWKRRGVEGKNFYYEFDKPEKRTTTLPIGFDFKIRGNYSNLKTYDYL